MNGSRIRIPASGIRSIVALSSMYLNLGISAKAQIGAKTIANHQGVQKKYQHANQIANIKAIE